MNDLVKESIFFGVYLTIASYQFGVFLQKKWKLSIFNPLLIATCCIITILVMCKIDYESYKKGGEYIQFFLTPVTVCLALPMYRQIRILKNHFSAIFISILCGVMSHAFVVVLLGRILSLKDNLVLSILPKSITTPIALGISQEINGIEVVTIIAVVSAGIVGSALGPAILKVFHIEEPIAQGLGIGTSSHAIGTSKAMELGELQGAMSSLAIVVTGVMTVIFIPILLKFI